MFSNKKKEEKGSSREGEYFKDHNRLKYFIL